jgi:hypothetical protein
MGVSELHKLGYIHRDLKPEVIMNRQIMDRSTIIDRIYRFLELLGRLNRTREVDRLWFGNWSAQPCQNRIDEEQGELYLARVVKSAWLNQIINQLDQVKDENLVIRSTLERKTMYKSMRMAEPRYVSQSSAQERHIAIRIH